MHLRRNYHVFSMEFGPREMLLHEANGVHQVRNILKHIGGVQKGQIRQTLTSKEDSLQGLETLNFSAIQ